MQITTGDLMAIGGKRAKMEICEPFAKSFNELAPQFGLTTLEAAAQFLGQCAVESAYFSDLDENLSYSAQRMTQVWPRRFPTIAAAQPYARNPEALANKTYGGRMGNKNPGDGWKYRGRGVKMLTGRYNYTKFNEWLKAKGMSQYDVVSNPDLVTQFPCALLSALWFWETNDLNSVCTDTVASTKKINGGKIGLKERIRCVDRAKEELADNGELDMLMTGRVASDGEDRDGDGIIDLGKVGKFHPSVKLIHDALTEMGYDPRPEEFYSQRTARMIRKFQSDAGIGADGVFGKGTKAAMEKKLGRKLKADEPDANDDGQDGGLMGWFS